MISISTSSLLKRCCRGSYTLRLQSTETLNSIHHPNYESKESSQQDIAESDGRPKQKLYSEVAADIITTVSDGKDSVTVDRRSKFAFYLPNHVKETMHFDGFSMQRLPTQRKLPVIQLPADLTSAMDVVLEGSIRSDLDKQAKVLLHKVRLRRAPMERQEWDRKMGIIYQGIIDKESVDPQHPSVLEDDRFKLLENREKAVKQRILADLGNYKPPVDYNSDSGCQAYMYSRLAYEYASLVKAFSQLRAALPHFSPSTLLDFGSGVGSVTWAMDKVWPRQCKQTVSIDSSAEMNQLNERLLRGGTDEGNLKQRRQHTYFRQFLPASASVKHNLVVMSRTMFDLANSEIRLRTLDILWRTVSPGGCLVLVEDGHDRACQLMLEARHFLLETENVDEFKTARIVAPCPHQFACPLLKRSQKTQTCTDSSKYFPYGTTGEAFRTTFSYLAFYKPTGNEASQDSDEQHQTAWPRIVQPVIKNSSITTVRVCNKFGNFQELAVVKSKHGSLCRTLSKACHLGDLFPVELLDPTLHVTPKTKIFEQILKTSQTVRDAHTDSAQDDKQNKSSFFKGEEES